MKLASIGLAASLGFAALLFGWTWTASHGKRRVMVDVDIQVVRTSQKDTKSSYESVTKNDDQERHRRLRDLEGKGQLLEPSVMLERLREQRQLWVDNQLKEDYGDKHYNDLFFYEDENGKRVSAGYKGIFKDAYMLPLPVKLHEPKYAVPKNEFPGWGRMIRKFQMKILQVQLGVIEESLEASRLRRNLANTNDNYEKPLADGTYTKFNWVTAGHSSSAGHGNLFRESYTASMERALKPILRHIGIDFNARPYSMGGFDSGEELALCINSVYGKDIDAMFWDFALTDSTNSLWKILMFAYRTAQISQLEDNLSQPGNIPHRPSFFAFNQNNDRNMVLQGMQELGLPLLAYDDDYYKEHVKPAIPEMFGLTDDQIEKTPRLVRSFKCEGKIETGEPGCQDDKWNTTVCPDRRFRTSWHPGWKYHALIGNLITTTMLDLLEEAIEGLMDSSNANNEGLMERRDRLTQQLQMLDREEAKDYKSIFDAPVPKKFLEQMEEKWWKEGRDTHLEDVDVETFLKEPGFCHTAVLPAEIRFRGLLTDNPTSTGSAVDETFDHGVSSEDLKSAETPEDDSAIARAFVDPRQGEDGLLMVKNLFERQSCDEEIVNVDFKDYFYVSSLQGTRTLTLPNKSEMQYYTEYNAKKGRMVLACVMRCDWGTCDKYDFHDYFGWHYKTKKKKRKHALVGAELASMGQLEITINGEKVTEASDMHTCFALRNIGGHIWFPNAKGQFEFQMTVQGASVYSYARFTSFILL